jgi:hypothetical protein
MMITLTESDFVPLDTFSLAWRWTDEGHASFPPESLGRIRPLTAVRAADIAPEATELCIGGDTAMVRLAGGDPAPVRAWLATLPVERGAAILLSWDVETAVATDWQTFVAHWDDFCYAGSDDVTVWSPDAPWYLCYDHEEVFRFGRHPAHNER